MILSIFVVGILLATTTSKSNETFDVWFDQDGLYCVHQIAITPHSLHREQKPDRYTHITDKTFKECVRSACKAHLQKDSTDTYENVLFIWEDGEHEIDIISLALHHCPDVFL